MEYMDYINARDSELVRRYCKTKFAKCEKSAKLRHVTELSSKEYKLCKNVFENGNTHADKFKG